MDSINSFKGYDKVNEGEERAFRQKTRRRIIIIAISCVVLVAVVIGAVVGTVIHKNNNNNDSNSSGSSTPSTSLADSVKAVCSVTQYPNSCFSSLQTANKSDPEELFKYSLQIAQDEIGKLTSLPEKLIAKVNSPRVKLALQDCKSLFEDAMDDLNTSFASMQVGPGENLLTSSKIDDLKTWLSSAITNQETCLDGLDEMNSTALLTQMKTAMKNSTEYTSNSLAIVAKIMTVLQDLEIPIHRKLLSFPEWVGRKERRLLQVTNPKADIVVAKDGSGDFTTIGDAVKTLGKKNKTRVVIYVKEGKYEEQVVLEKAHWNIMMYGDGKTKTIVSSSLNFIDGTPTFSTATFIAAGKGFIAKDMGFMNEAGAEKHQAVAFRSGSDESVFYRCSFDAYQDTLYAHSNRQFYRECDITGTIDFIFGNAAVIFQECSIKPRQPLPNQFNTITAQGKKDPNQNGGISIQRGVITPLDNLTARTYLGRPWKDYSTTVIMKVDINAVVDPVGWTPWVTNVEPPNTIYYAEYQNTGAGSNVDRRVKWAGYKPAISDDEAQKFALDPFIQGSEWLPKETVTFDSAL